MSVVCWENGKTFVHDGLFSFFSGVEGLADSDNPMYFIWLIVKYVVKYV